MMHGQKNIKPHIL